MGAPVLVAAEGKRRLLLTGSAIDSLGSGFWMPFGLIFFTTAQGLPVAQVGVALTIGGLGGLVFGPVAGNLVDNRGAAPVLLASNVLRAVTFSLYPLTGHAWQVAALAVVTSASDRMFWTSNAPLLGCLAQGRELDRLLGTQSVIRIIGLGAGAAVATPFIGDAGGLHLVSYLNAATFAVTASIVYPVARSLAVPAQARKRTGSWRRVLGDRPYLLVCLGQALFSLCASSLVVILPLVSVESLGGPPWLPGGSIVAGNVVLAVIQKPVLRLAERTSRGGVISVAGLVFAGAFLVMLGGPPLGPGYAAAIVLATSMIGVVGETLSVPLMTAAANQSAPEDAKGRYSALFQTCWGAAGASSPALCSGLLTLGYQVLWVGLAVIALATVPVVALASRSMPALTERSQ
ncbi:MFS transporter [Amycolatopsis sp. cmx-4-61]|uniref:MFS transporter n=1 Tax=Amycolatopsis sp. cmx-4-61 TaxID=2790937 RepID=UPI00397A1F76